MKINCFCNLCYYIIGQKYAKIWMLYALTYREYFINDQKFISKFSTCSKCVEIQKDICFSIPESDTCCKIKNSILPINSCVHLFLGGEKGLFNNVFVFDSFFKRFIQKH